MKTIKAGQTLTSRSICDYNCIFKLEVISVSPKMAVINFQNKTRKVKINIDADGNQFLKPDNYSMAPTFKALN
jgi:hypothetical protein